MRPRQSLLTRLLLWQSGTIVFTLSILTIALFFIVTTRLRQHHDDDLIRACSDARALLEAYDTSASRAGLDDALDDLGHDATLRQLLPGDPPLVDGTPVGEVRLDNRAARRVGSAEGDASHDHRPSGSMRVASTLAYSADGVPFLVEVSENLGDLDSTMQSLRLVLLTVAPLVLLFSIGVSAVILVRALKPLRSVVRWASSLEADRLGSRLEVDEGFQETMVLVDAFNQMTERLANSFQQVQEFAANASHELRTPLTSLTSSFEVVLQKERGSTEYREALVRSLPEVRRLNRIVENLLVMAQADAGDVELRTTGVELDSILLESYEALCHDGLSSGVTIELGDMDVGSIEADPHWLRQLFDNLIGNAVKYSLPNGVVTVSATSSADEVRVVIEDNGIGIPEGDRERIFSRYYRVQDPRGEKVAGVGLGLSIAKWAAEAHGGRIEVEGAEPRGSCFIVVLPTRRAARPLGPRVPARSGNGSIHG